jgi:hypothetical protein
MRGGAETAAELVEHGVGDLRAGLDLGVYLPEVVLVTGRGVQAQASCGDRPGVAEPVRGAAYGRQQVAGSGRDLAFAVMKGQFAVEDVEVLVVATASGGVIPGRDESSEAVEVPSAERSARSPARNDSCTAASAGPGTASEQVGARSPIVSAG